MYEEALRKLGIEEWLVYGKLELALESIGLLWIRFPGTVRILSRLYVQTQSENLSAVIKKINMLISCENVKKVTLEGKFFCAVCRK